MNASEPREDAVAGHLNVLRVIRDLYYMPDAFKPSVEAAIAALAQQGASLEGERYVDVHSTFYREPLPVHDPAKANTEQGLYRKFDVRRTDGSDAPGGKHHGCEYFVLDVSHDRHAPHALLAYAKAAQATHPDLARDLMDRYDLDVYERAALSKASPDDQRQEGEVSEGEFRAAQSRLTASAETNATAEAFIAAAQAASPPTEAAAAVGDLRSAEHSMKAGGQTLVTYRVLDTNYHAPMRVRLVPIDAALSPTASAAREGSDA